MTTYCFIIIGRKNKIFNLGGKKEGGTIAYISGGKGGYLGLFCIWTRYVLKGLFRSL